MYLEIQVLAGFPELEIASFANTFRCSMYLEIQVLRGFPEPEIATSTKKFRRFGAPGYPIFGDFREQVPAF